MAPSDYLSLLSHYAWPLIGSFSLVFLTWTLYRLFSPFRKLPYPPGPPAQSLLWGNLSDYPTAFAWRVYIEWGEKYGDILHYRLFDKHTIVLNSYEDNVELLEKRSAIYSDRPYMPLLDLMGWLSFDVGFMQYGAEWRAHRRIFQKIFRPKASLKYRPTQTRKLYDFLYGLLTTPEDFVCHQRTFSAAIIMSVMYGHDVAPKNDHFVDLAKKAMGQILMGAGLSGVSLLYALPILRFIPAWFPGAGFKRFSLEAKKLAFEMRDIPMESVQKRMKDGVATNCATVELLETCQSKEEFDVISGVAATGYVAGSDTTTSPIGTFFQVILMLPDIQRRAKKEIDAVVGSERLVTLDDRPFLPYIEALYREVMRWRPAVPLSVAHGSTVDDIYKGYFIPKGTSIISNVWAIAYDHRRYSDPEIFDPDRFFNANGGLSDDDVGYVFGFGRRICPGRHIASSSVWLAIASVLQIFDIEKKRDSKGKEIPVNGGYADGLILRPLPFECSITPRSAEAREIVLEARVGKSS